MLHLEFCNDNSISKYLIWLCDVYGWLAQCCRHCFEVSSALTMAEMITFRSWRQRIIHLHWEWSFVESHSRALFYLKKHNPFFAAGSKGLILTARREYTKEEVVKGRHVSSGIPALTGGTSRRAVSSRPARATDIVITSHINRTRWGRWIRSTHLVVRISRRSPWLTKTRQFSMSGSLTVWVQKHGSTSWVEPQAHFFGCWSPWTYQFYKLGKE